MKPIVLGMAVAAMLAVPAVASAQNVYVQGKVSGKWVIDPRLCPDLREDIRDSRVTTSRHDLREDYRDAQVVNCPASAYTFIPNKGQAPTRVIRRTINNVLWHY